MDIILGNGVRHDSRTVVPDASPAEIDRFWSPIAEQTPTGFAHPESAGVVSSTDASWTSGTAQTKIGE